MKHLNVFYDGHGEHQLVGQLAMDGRQPVFQYQGSPQKTEFKVR